MFQYFGECCKIFLNLPKWFKIFQNFQNFLPALPGPQRSFWAFDLGIATDIALLVYCSVIGVWHVVMLSKAYCWVVLDRVLVVVAADFDVAHKQLS